MSAIDECTNNFTLLSDFFQARSNYVLSGGTYPDLDAAIGGIKYDELLTFAAAQAEESADYQSGSSVEAVNSLAAIQREYDIGRQSKLELFNSIVSTELSEASFFEQSGTYYRGVLTGSPSNGSQC